MAKLTIKMRRIYLLLCVCFLIAITLGCSQPVNKEVSSLIEKEVIIVPKKIPVIEVKPEVTDLGLFDRVPTQWGEFVTGVKTRIKTDEQQISLTFDACGSNHGKGYDEALISFLRAENIPATLFMNERWIHANPTIFLELATDPLFQIENHGTHHAPLSVVGGEAWGIQATQSPQEAHDEIMKNHETVLALTGREMTLFRSGTAFYDEVAVELANTLGYEVVNFDILGDAGATYSSGQVKNALLNAKAGSIALMHMNHPESGTAEGVRQAVPLLQALGFEFVLLENKTLE